MSSRILLLLLQIELIIKGVCCQALALPPAAASRPFLPHRYRISSSLFSRVLDQNLSITNQVLLLSKELIKTIQLRGPAAGPVLDKFGDD
jgi:hypothetical protein